MNDLEKAFARACEAQTHLQTLHRELEVTPLPLSPEKRETICEVLARSSAANAEYFRLQGLALKSPTTTTLASPRAPKATGVVRAKPAPRLTSESIETAHGTAAQITLARAIGDGSAATRAQIHLARIVVEDVWWGRPAFKKSDEFTMSILHFARPRGGAMGKDPLARFRNRRYFRAIRELEVKRDGVYGLNDLPEYAAIREITRAKGEGDRSEEALTTEVERLYTIARESVVAVWPYVCWVAVGLLRGEPPSSGDGSDAWEAFRVSSKVSAVQRKHGVDIAPPSAASA